MKWLLALLSAASCVALGGLFSRRVILRSRLALAWEEAMARMEGAVTQGEALRDVLLHASDGRLPPLAEAADRLQKQPAAQPEAWLADLPWDPLLLPEEQETLKACLRGLFAPSAEMQLRALRFSQAQWQAVSRRCREEKEKNGRLYQRLGWLGGAALFILMC